jgi:transcriptional regulator with XRE-family HTH domain
MNQPISDIFRAALEKKIREMGRGGQARLADKAGLSRSYLNDILKGRTRGDEDTRRAIAAAAGYAYEEFLELGRAMLGLVSCEDEWPYASGAEQYGPHSVDRAYFIWEKGCEDMGTPGVYDRVAHDAYISRYLRREISDADLYEAAREYARDLLERIRKREK